MRIDGPSRCFVTGDLISRMSPTQAAIMRQLVDNSGRYVSVDELAAHVSRNMVWQEMARIRKILAYHGLDLVTARGKGCRIINGAR